MKRSVVTFCSTISTISHPRKWTFFPASSHKQFGLKKCVMWLMHGCKLSMHPPCDTRVHFLVSQLNSLRVLHQSEPNAAQYNSNSENEFRLSHVCQVYQGTVITAQLPLYFWDKCTQVKLFKIPVPSWLCFANTILYYTLRWISQQRDELCIIISDQIHILVQGDAYIGTNDEQTSWSPY
jgi:hypothetical protein